MHWLKKFSLFKVSAVTPCKSSAPQVDTCVNVDLAEQLAELADQKRWPELETITAPLAEAATSPGLLRYHGLALLHLGKPAQALNSLDRALMSDPTDVVAQVACSRAHEAMGDKEAALDAAMLALHYSPDSPLACLQYGQLCKLAENTVVALEHFRKAITLDPSYAEAYLALASALHGNKDYQGAVAAYQRAIDLGQSSPDILNNFGHALLSLEQYEESIPYFLESLKLEPNNSITQINLGCAYRHVGNDAAAIEQFETVLRHQPNSYEARWYLCHIWLALGQWERGWDQYECRFASEAALSRALPFKPWLDEPLADQTILVYAEQGVGDEMMFASCLPDIIKRAGHCVLECNARLVTLFQRSFPEATVLGCDHEYIPRWLPKAPKIDYQIPLGSLPRHFRRSIDAFPRHTGYLRADPALVEKWRGRFDALGPGLRVAISWKGGTAQTRTMSRSIDPESWEPILLTPNIHFISLQYGKCTEDVRKLQIIAGENRVHHWQDAIDDFDETAGLLMNVDVVITVCNTLVHLSGALGRPVWILSPAVPEWRYLRTGDSLPWYPSSQIMRQPVPGDWSPVIGTYAIKLKKMLVQST